jgi:hypothetical protein
VREAAAAGTLGTLDAANTIALGRGGQVGAAELLARVRSRWAARAGAGEVSPGISPPEVRHAQELGDQIAAGHAYDKHVEQGGQYPGIETREQFSAHIQDVIHHGERRELDGGGMAYWKDGTVVIENPLDPDGGTAFRPDDGYEYFREVLR